MQSSIYRRIVYRLSRWGRGADRIPDFGPFSAVTSRDFHSHSACCLATMKGAPCATQVNFQFTYDKMEPE